MTLKTSIRAWTLVGLVAGPAGAAAADQARLDELTRAVEPRVIEPASLNRMNTRFAAGSNGTEPAPITNTLNVGVAPALIVVVTVPPGGARHAPFWGLV